MNVQSIARLARRDLHGTLHTDGPNPVDICLQRRVNPKTKYPKRR